MLPHLTGRGDLQRSGGMAKLVIERRDRIADRLERPQGRPQGRPDPA